MNFSRLFGYVKRRGRPGINMKLEFASALAVASAILCGTIWSLPPINLPVEFKYRFRDYVEQRIQSYEQEPADRTSTVRVHRPTPPVPEGIAARSWD